MGLGEIKSKGPPEKNSPEEGKWNYHEYAPDLIDILKEKGITVKTLSAEVDAKWQKETGIYTQPVFLPNAIDLNRVEDNPDAKIFLKALSPDAGPRDYLKSARLAKKYMNEETGGTIYIPERWYPSVDQVGDHYSVGKEIRKDITDALTAANIVKKGLKRPAKSLAKFTFGGGEKAFRDPKKEEEYLTSIGIDKHGDILGKESDTEEDVWRRVGKGEQYDAMVSRVSSFKNLKPSSHLGAFNVGSGGNKFSEDAWEELDEIS